MCLHSNLLHFLFQVIINFCRHFSFAFNLTQCSFVISRQLICCCTDGHVFVDHDILNHCRNRLESTWHIAPLSSVVSLSAAVRMGMSLLTMTYSIIAGIAWSPPGTLLLCHQSSAYLLLYGWACLC